MCEITTALDSAGEMDVVCDISGKPINISNDYGNFCEDECDLQDAINKAATYQALLLGIGDLFGRKFK